MPVTTPVTVKDAQTGIEWTYDMAKPLETADDGLAFAIGQLTNLETKIYETKYGPIIFQEIVPVDMSDPEWVDRVDYISYDAVTVGKFIGANAADLPQSDLKAAKSSIEVFYGGNSFGYSLDELRKSQQLRIPLDVEKGKASYRGFQEHAQNVALFGDSDRGVTGLFNNANVQSDNTSIDWFTATGEEKIAEMNSLLIKVWTNSKHSHLPDTFLLPDDEFATISGERMDSGTDTTVLEFFMKNNLYTQQTKRPLDVRGLIQLQDAGAAGAPRMMAYEKTPENLTMRMPMAWRTVPPQPKGLGIDVPAEYKFGGVEFRYPGSAAYRDLVTP